MESRNWKCLVLGPTGNLQGSYKFLDLNTGKKLKKQAWTPMLISYAIIKRAEQLAALYRRSCSSGGWILRNLNNERYAEGAEGDYDKPLIKQEFLHADIPAELPGVKLECEQSVSEIQEANTDNPAAVEESAARALANPDITFPHPKEVPQVMNEAPEVSHDEDDEEFDINKAENTKTQVDDKEPVEVKTFNKKMTLLKTATRAIVMKTTYCMYGTLIE